MSGSLNNYLEYTRGKVNSVLYGLFFTPLSLIYGLGVSLRNFAYDHGLISSFEPSLPVISIGNITMGGTNKTPFVEMLARKFLTLGLNPGLVTRGYGGKHKDKGPILVVNGKGDRGQVGDESLLLSSRLPGVPVAVSLDRLAALEMLRWENKVDIAISDDTFQHRRMVRDVDIVLIDATCPFGNGKLFPAGALRESPKNLKRAHILVITKADQVKEEALAELISLVRKYASDKPIFTSRLVLERWQKWDGDQFVDTDPLNPDLPVSIFSAIGNPESFRNFIENMGFNVKSEMRYRDHHMYSRKDLDNIARRCKLVGAKVAICTEKDVYNLPQGCLIDIPIYVPSVVTVVSEESRFFETLIETLRPKIVITSNGHGEDSMACLLAERIRKDLPKAKLYAFPLVGKGKIFEDSGIEVYPPPLDTPSGGVIKYSFFELIKDVRAGLLGHVKRQLDAWSRLRGKIRTPICVGDVYLLLHALYGQGVPPLLLATAKTVYLRGHFLIEKQILRKKSRKVWTRDEMTARELRKSFVNAVYVGNPIMDLTGDNNNAACKDPWTDKEGRRILLLPGSRQDAYKDVRLLLKAAELVTKQIKANFLMVIAPSIEWSKMISSLEGYLFEDNLLR
ncbi:MAG: tetraacyldisaccharide 4'-kinase, partial [Acetomicrobium sp.]